MTQAPLTVRRLVRPHAYRKSTMAISVALIYLSNTANAADEKLLKVEASAAIVTGNPLGLDADQLVVPVSALSERELSLRRSSTLGETLNTIPGISASNFGPNASRPVIRGMDADRVKMMQNGTGALDASALSPDHAVAIDPMIVERIEVMRGPAALLYGGNAMGGVVNAIDHRIPKEPLDGVIGRGEVSYGGADDQKSGVAVVDFGNGKFALHADAYRRKSEDLEIPGFAVSNKKNQSDGTPQVSSGRLINSASEGHGGALGAAFTFDNGYAGMSYSQFNSEYGTVAEPEVKIDMVSDRIDFSSEFRELGNVINRVKFRMAHTDYQHQELEEGLVGTTFTNQGIEGTLELAHGKIGLLSGVIGLQFQSTEFEANGAEAFIPKTNSDNQAIYVYEELPLDAFKLTMGGRVERATVESAGGGPDDITLPPGNPRFGNAQSKKFTPYSIATGALFNINQHWSFTGNFSHTERAPSYNELFANGPHLATGQFELGDTSLGKEKSNGVDAQIRWKTNAHSFSLGVFYTRFSNFVSLFNTANTRGVDGELNPIDGDGDGVADGSGEDILAEAQIRAVPAVFKGIEMEGKFRLYGSNATDSDPNRLDLGLRGDLTRATNLNTDQSLPRIPPLRLGASLSYQQGDFGAKLDLLRAFQQNRIDSNELATDGYTMLNATLSYKLPKILGTGELEFFAKANNLLDEEAREHTSILKDIAPLAGRSLLVGVRGEF